MMDWLPHIAWPLTIVWLAFRVECIVENLCNYGDLQRKVADSVTHLNSLESRIVELTTSQAAMSETCADVGNRAEGLDIRVRNLTALSEHAASLAQDLEPKVLHHESLLVSYGLTGSFTSKPVES